MIQLKNIYKTYSTGFTKVEVLKGINLEINQGELVSIMGASGSGKSTLLNIIGILDNYDSGEYSIDNKQLKHLSEIEAAYYRNHMMGFVFQSMNLIPYKNALENISLPLFYQKVSRLKRNAIAMEYLDRFGLKDWATHFPNELSGGQRQRVAIARALICKPKIILADEPTGQLDSKSSMDVLNLIKEVNKEGITVIIVTHEHDIAKETQRIINIKDGKIV